MQLKTISQMVQARTITKDSRKLRRRDLFQWRPHSRNLREGPTHIQAVRLTDQVERLERELRDKPIAPTLVRCKLSGQYFQRFDDSKQPRFGTIGTIISSSNDLEQVLHSRIGLTVEST